MLVAVRRFSLALLAAGALAACQQAAEKTAPTAALPNDPGTHEPWSAQQLMAPAELAARLTGAGAMPVIFDMGPAGTIKGARKIGPAQEEGSLQQLRTALAKLPKSQEIVVYCGCCPFEPCPNIRPAFRTLRAQGFQNIKLLNLAHNLKADWIDQGYPLAP